MSAGVDSTTHLDKLVDQLRKAYDEQNPYSPLDMAHVLEPVMRECRFDLAELILEVTPPPGSPRLECSDFRNFPNVLVKVQDERVVEGVKLLDALHLACEYGQDRIVKKLCSYHRTREDLNWLYGLTESENDVYRRKSSDGSWIRRASKGHRNPKNGTCLFYDPMIAAIGGPVDNFLTSEVRVRCVHHLLTACPGIVKDDFGSQGIYLEFAGLTRQYLIVDYLCRWWIDTQVISAKSPWLVYELSHTFGSPCTQHQSLKFSYNVKHERPSKVSTTTDHDRPAPYSTGCSWCALRCAIVLVSVSKARFDTKEVCQITEKECKPLEGEEPYYDAIVALRKEFVDLLEDAKRL